MTLSHRLRIVVVGMAALATIAGCTHTASDEAQSPATSPAVVTSSAAPSPTPTIVPPSPTLSSTPPEPSVSTSPTAQPSSASPSPSDTPKPSATPKASPSPKPSAAPTHTTNSSPTPAAIVLQSGSKGANVTLLEEGLYQSVRGAFYQACNYDASFGPMALKALEQWQKAAGQPVTGKIQVGSTQWQLLKREATANRLLPGISTASVTYVVQYGKPLIDYGKTAGCAHALAPDPTAPHGVKVTISSGASSAGLAMGTDHKYHEYTTPNGMFQIGWQDPDGVNAYSHSYFHADMPWATCFIGHDVCFHYDGDAPSHGCVHVHDKNAAHELYLLPRGTEVNVHI